MLAAAAGRTRKVDDDVVVLAAHGLLDKGPLKALVLDLDRVLLDHDRRLDLGVAAHAHVPRRGDVVLAEHVVHLAPVQQELLRRNVVDQVGLAQVGVLDRLFQREPGREERDEHVAHGPLRHRLVHNRLLRERQHHNLGERPQALQDLPHGVAV